MIVNFFSIYLVQSEKAKFLTDNYCKTILRTSKNLVDIQQGGQGKNIFSFHSMNSVKH